MSCVTLGEEVEECCGDVLRAIPEQVEDVDGEPVRQPQGDVAPDVGTARRPVDQDQGRPVAEDVVGDLAPRERETPSEVPGFRHQSTLPLRPTIWTNWTSICLYVSRDEVTTYSFGP